MPTATKTRLVIEIESDLLEQLEGARYRTDGEDYTTVEEIVAERLARTIGYDLTGSPLFLDHTQHARLRAISGASAVGGAEKLIDRLEALTRIGIEGEQLTLRTSWIERLASRAKIENKTPAQLAAEYALEGIRERIGM